VEAAGRVVRVVSENGAVPGIQLPTPGARRASAPRGTRAALPGWPPMAAGVPVAPSALPFADGHARPEPLDEAGIAGVVRAFADGARRALDAGFQVVEIHAAHGYLLHEFLSPLSNHRGDRYGGSLENRTRIVRETVEGGAPGLAGPAAAPPAGLVHRLDAGGLGPAADRRAGPHGPLARRGRDRLLVGRERGHRPHPGRPWLPGPFAEGIRRDAAIATAAVGMITSPAQAETVIRSGQADLVLLAASCCATRSSSARRARAGVEGPWPASTFARSERRPSVNPFAEPVAVLSRKGWTGSRRAPWVYRSDVATPPGPPAATWWRW